MKGYAPALRRAFISNAFIIEPVPIWIIIPRQGMQSGKNTIPKPLLSGRVC